jgi:hypothetical protein
MNERSYNLVFEKHNVMMGNNYPTNNTYIIII